MLSIATTSKTRASNVVPAPPQTRPILLTGATIHPVSGPSLTNSQILLVQGKIQALGSNLTRPTGTEVVDVSGKHIYPGLISANTVLGLVEISSVRGTLDLSEPGAVNPNARAAVSVNPDSELFPVARANGVLAALTVPQSRGGLVAGTSSLLKLDGWTWEEMTLKPTVGLHVFWPNLVINRDPRFPKSPEDQKTDQDKQLRQLKEAFATARAYQKARTVNPSTLKDARWEAMLPVLSAKVPVFIHAGEIKQIQSALQWADGEKLAVVLVGGQDAWRMTTLLKERNIPVILSQVMDLPLRRSDSYDSIYSSPRKLFEAGVKFCVANDGTDFAAHQDRNLPYQAGMAAAFGLPKEEALKSVTLYPAQILGVADRMGSLEVGKDATLIITTGDPLEVTTQVERAYIQGRPLDLTNRQTRLYEKYRQKYEQIK